MIFVLLPKLHCEDYLPGVILVFELSLRVEIFDICLIRLEQHVVSIRVVPRPLEFENSCYTEDMDGHYPICEKLGHAFSD